MASFFLGKDLSSSMKFIQRNIWLLAVVILSFWTIAPLFSLGFYPMHDDTQVARVSQMAKALSDGMFPVRFVADLGYGFGYPIFNFYAPLAYYVGSFFVLLGHDVLSATKLMIGLGAVIGGISMFLLAARLFNKKAGLVAAVFYMYAPYHGVNMYVRGDIAEMWAYGILPLVFLGVYQIAHTLGADVVSKESEKLPQNQRVWMWVGVTAFAYAGVILSHNLTAMMVTPFVVLFAAFHLFTHRLFTPRLVLFASVALLLGVCISAFYSFPVFPEMKYTNVLSQVGGGADFRDHFVCLPQLWESQWGYGGSTPLCTDGFSFRLGKLHVFFASLALLLLPFGRKNKVDLFALFFLLGFVASIILMLPVSRQLWESVSLMAFFQYPWRFLLMASFFSSVLTGYSAYKILFLFQKYVSAKPFSILAILFLCSSVIFLNAELFVPQTIHGKTAADFTNNTAIRWTASRISDEYMPPGFFKPNNENEVANIKIVAASDFVQVEASAIDAKTNAISGNVSATKNGKVRFQLAHFPAWEFFLNSEHVGPEKVHNGYVVSVPKGESVVKAVFKQTPIERVANIFTLFGITIAILGIIVGSQKRKK